MDTIRERFAFMALLLLLAGLVELRAVLATTHEDGDQAAVVNGHMLRRGLVNHDNCVTDFDARPPVPINAVP
jgi:hypothetical protein